MAMTLNESQMKFKEAFINKHTKERRSAGDSSEFCYTCNFPGDCRDPNSRFAAYIPPINPRNLSKGIMMDAMKAVWICAVCSTILKDKS